MILSVISRAILSSLLESLVSHHYHFLPCPSITALLCVITPSVLWPVSALRRRLVSTWSCIVPDSIFPDVRCRWVFLRSASSHHVSVRGAALPLIFFGTSPFVRGGVTKRISGSESSVRSHPESNSDSPPRTETAATQRREGVRGW